MRKQFTTAFMAFIMLFVFTSVIGGGYPNNNALAGKAKAAFNNSCTNYTGATVTSIRVVSACFAGGFITEVLVYPKLNCNQIDCDLVRVGPVGRVTFGCGGEVMSVECLGFGS